MIDPDLQQILDDAQAHMHKSLEHLAVELSHIRAGRANPTMVEDVRVDAYGSPMPLNQVASVSAPAPDLIVIQPWDRSTLGPIERGIMAANLGLNPTNDGTLIRISIPPLTQERRAELAKASRGKGEDAKVAIRNVRKDTKNHIGRYQQEAKLPEDMRFEAEDQLQKLTDQHIARVDEMLAKKEHDIMAV